MWSIGCILLEFVLGRETFTSMWMGSYALEVLTNQASFQNEILSRTAAIHTKILASDNEDIYSYSNILKGLLNFTPDQRWTMSQVRDLEWLNIQQYENKHNIAMFKNGTIQVGPILSRLSSSSHSLSTNSSDQDVEELTTIMSNTSMDEHLSTQKQTGNNNTNTNTNINININKQLAQTLTTTTSTTTSTTAASELGPIKTNGNGRPRSAGSSALVTTPSAKQKGPSSLASRRSQKLNITTNFQELERGGASPATIKQRAGQIQLPNITSPNTPKIRGARKILDSGTAIVRQLGLEADSPVRRSNTSMSAN